MFKFKRFTTRIHYTAPLFLSSLLFNSQVSAEESILVTADPSSVDSYQAGYAVNQAEVATKTHAPLVAIPQLVSVVNRQQMDVQSANTVSQALRYNAGVASERYGAFSSGVDFARIRGFDADYYLDGLRVIGNTGIWGPQIETWGLQSVEVLHGPSSSLYGQGGSGGVINMISRKPSAILSNQFKLDFGNYNSRSLSLDSTGSLTDDKQWLYRFDGLAVTRDTQIEETRQKRLYLAPAVTWQPNEHTSWTVLTHYLREPRSGYYNTLPAQVVGLLPNPQGKLDTSRNYSDPSHENSTRTQYDITSLFELHLNDRWELKQNLRYSHVDSVIRRDFTRAVTPNERLLTAVYQDSPSKADSLVMDNQVVAQFVTGPVDHQWLTGIDFQTGKLDKNWWGSQTVTFDPWSSHYRPTFNPVPVSRTSTTQRFHRVGVYSQDEANWRGWHLLLSGRHDWSKMRTDNNLAHTQTKTDDAAWSYRTGLSYPFDNGLAPWISVSTAFEPLTGTNASGNPFKPTHSVQYETGLKFQPPGSSVMNSLAVYQLTQRDVNTIDPLNPAFYTQTGEVRSRGVELESRAALTDNLNIMLSYAWVNNVVTSANDNTQGRHPVGVPAQTGSIWLDYRFNKGPLQGLLIGGGTRYLGASWGNGTNTFRVPAVWLSDMSIRYTPGAWDAHLYNLELGLTLNNLTNKSYVASCTSAPYCSIGVGRNVTGSISWFF
ncbi:TonB-dependent siderophore receptor [Salmonella enterica]|nr:TonB-dependent siderophore receptor [Salmonella enterica]EJA5857611.1 TonB-dependent siderophore receptor [Salmonella enterica]EJF5731664.1 TonB-dependent siderophore receptor [Salmonella enterica]EJU3354621.1 TonB-dependent siderophore receptor [Salmonella enterica]EJX4304739.1 TonB-dependent siderophore receptor [Salmonella enterica]